MLARIKAGFAALGIIAVALVATAIAMFRKGKRAQADADAASKAQAEARAARVARDAYTDAVAAAAQVRADAAKRPPPDPVQRNDFDNTF